MNTEHVWPGLCLLCDHPLCSVQRRGPWERFRVSDVLAAVSVLPPSAPDDDTSHSYLLSHQADHCSQTCLARSLRYDEPITYNTD